MRLRPLEEAKGLDALNARKSLEAVNELTNNFAPAVRRFSK